MARHFAEVGLDGVVKRVILADSEAFMAQAFPGTVWVETHNPNEPAHPGFEPWVRPTYAGVGMRYDWVLDDFVRPG
jgi:hypothetical protein